MSLFNASTAVTRSFGLDSLVLYTVLPQEFCRDRSCFFVTTPRLTRLQGHLNCGSRSLGISRRGNSAYKSTTSIVIHHIPTVISPQANQVRRLPDPGVLATNTAGIGVAVGTFLPRRPSSVPDMAKLRVIPNCSSRAAWACLTMFSTAGVQLSAVGAIFHSCAVALGHLQLSLNLG